MSVGASVNVDGSVAMGAPCVRCGSQLETMNGGGGGGGGNGGGNNGRNYTDPEPEFGPPPTCMFDDDFCKPKKYQSGNFGK